MNTKPPGVFAITGQPMAKQCHHCGSTNPTRSPRRVGDNAWLIECGSCGRYWHRGLQAVANQTGDPR